jgi:hypothetical integral membrane protein (TIGR02206 family)
VDPLQDEHLAVVALTAAAALLAPAWARAAPPARRRLLARTLAVALLAAYAAEHALFLARGTWRAERNLPLHLSDVTVLVSATALWTARPLVVELTWSWALTASLAALLTPDLAVGAESPFFWTFTVTHALPIVAAALLVAGLGLRPRPGALVRVIAATALVATAAAAATLLTGGNYMFLRRPPEEASLLDLLGPWPWYVVAAAGLAVVLFALLDALTRRAGRTPRRSRRRSARPG